MRQAEIRSIALNALKDMARSDILLEQSERESIPSVAKMLREDSAVMYRCALLGLKDAVNKLT